MSVVFHASFDKDFPDDFPPGASYSEYTDWKDLAASVLILDEICAEHALKPITTFTHDLESLPASMPETDLYFDPSHGLRVVSGLIQAFRSDPRVHDKFKDYGGAVEETVLLSLQKIEHLLKRAVQERSRFFFDWY